MSEKTNEHLDEIETIKAMNIFQKIAAVSAEVGKVAMTLEVPTNGNNSYKAISINDVVDSLIPLLKKYNLVILPGEKEIIEQAQIKTTTKFGERMQFYIRLKATYILYNADNPSELVKSDGYGDGIDSGDKATGKANTYARKYALIDMFNLSKGDDPDKEASQEYQKIEMCTPEQSTKIISLYSADEINKMLKRLKKNSLAECTFEQAARMIAKRDMGAVSDPTPTF